MFCENCGKEIKDDGRFCPNCGCPVPGENNGPVPPVNHRQYIRPINFWKFFLLGLVTFGIYNIYTMWHFTNGVNEMCKNDGKKSMNYICVVLLSAVTFGIYGFYWYYTQGKRLYETAPGYQAKVKENGMFYLLWMLFLPGIGTMIAAYHLFKNYNAIVDVYNRGGECQGIFRRQKASTTQKVLLGLVIAGKVLLMILIPVLLWNMMVSAVSDAIYSSFEDVDFEESEPVQTESDEVPDTEMVSESVTFPLTVINNTGEDIYELYASVVHTDDWEEDILGANILESGDSFVINFEITEDTLVWDFKIENEDGDMLEFYDVDFSDYHMEGAMLIFNADGTATMANEGDDILEGDDADGEFIGLNGTYHYMDSDGNVISSIEISQDGQFCDFVLHNTELNYDIVSGEGKVIDGKTVQIPLTGFTVFCTWSDSEHMRVTREGDPYGMDAGLIIDYTDDVVYEYVDMEENTLVQNAYTFLVGNGFHLVNMQPALYFVSEDEIRYVPGGEQSDEYYQYEIFLKTENYHDEQVWREWIRIGSDEYRMYFSDNTFSLEGGGPFSGTYEKI